MSLLFKAAVLGYPCTISGDIHCSSCKLEFFNPIVMDIWNQIILCWGGGYPLYHKIFKLNTISHSLL